ncbi:hypothetical protein [Kineobactrum salinum]|uniref:Bacteriocin n=1 Tax=Kineobactrum salinum TaxID=2708301 RepID=A0A6C0U0R6_9GAMM|nr:hypothetical protein [Kineobactrum salinum]QIB65712.1 hypothetical protein G3T16_10085 [Kineobactrum salinum]
MNNVNVCDNNVLALQGRAELSTAEIDMVAGGMSDWTAGGMAVIGLGITGGPVTAGFGLAIGGAMMFIGHVSGGSSGSSKYMSH